MTTTLITDYVGRGSHAARPVTPDIPAGATALYYETDTGNSFVWTGSIWLQVNAGAAAGGLFSEIMSSAPTAAGTGFGTWLNQGSATVADAATGIALNITSGNGSAHVVHGRLATVPATPYTKTALLLLEHNGLQYSAAGVGWSDGTKIHAAFFQNEGGTQLTVQETTWATASSTPSFPGTATKQWNSHVWLRLADNGTNVTLDYSLTGVIWTNVFTIAKASGFLGASGYTNFIYFIDNYSQRVGSVLHSWQ